MADKTNPNYEEVTKVGDASLFSIHPIAGAHKALKRTNLPAWGGSDGNESKFVRCKQCGFILDSTRTPRGSGYGNETAVLKSGETSIYNDVTSIGGCPLCAASEY